MFKCGSLLDYYASNDPTFMKKIITYKECNSWKNVMGFSIDGWRIQNHPEGLSVQQHMFLSYTVSSMLLAV